jgi:hypothetical protein
MPPELRIFWIGIAIYFTSFFLPGIAIDPDASPWLGFLCAFYALILPFDHSMKLPGSSAVFLFISGLINPVFIAAAFLKLSGVTPLRATILRTAVLIMLPFTIGFFALDKFSTRPREGYFLWIGAILMVLLADKLAGIGKRMASAAS